MRTIIRNARVLTMDGMSTQLPRATVTIENDTIVAVAADDAGVRDASVHDARGRDAEEREIEAGGHLLMPGLVNGHFHSSANHLKGSLDSLPLEIFMLFETPADGARDDARSAYVSTLLGAVEMLKGGVTSVLDDAFFVPAPSPAAIDAIMQAYADSGMRASLALDQPNVPEIDKLPFLKDLLPPELLARARQPAAMDSEGLLVFCAATRHPRLFRRTR
jgi:5-methylthioadenosine/S-adenosylhomocysteine deaminase